MHILNPSDIADILKKFFVSANNPALFAGAGVAARAGLPDWHKYMEHLAAVTDRYDQDAGALIRRRIKQDQFLNAATIYKTCPFIPKGEKYKQIGFPFLNIPNPEKLIKLASLKFVAAFTTNYDRSLHHAFAAVMKTSPHNVELKDATMRGAEFISHFYIARIHGRVEVPEEIVLDEEDYNNIEKNEIYVRFLCHILTKYTCLFIGFSFLDPAITNIFSIIDNRVPPESLAPHFALLSSEADSYLVSKLTSLNFQVFKYDISADHSVLWEGIDLASKSFSKEEKTIKPQAFFPLDSIKRFVATSYARIKLEKQLKPLRDMVIDGIILDVLSDIGKKGISFEEIAGNLKKILFLSKDESNEILQQRIDVLTGRGLCQVKDDVIVLSKNIKYMLEKDIRIIIDGIINRIRIRESQPISDQLIGIIEQCLEEILLARGWDLGAHFAGATIGLVPNILNTISSSLKKQALNLPLSTQDAIKFAFYDIFNRPEQRESKVLAELGRIAFTLNLIFNNPCSTIALEAVLPERIYLDANFLMPAIVEGHPFQSLYKIALGRLKTGASSQGMKVNVGIAEDFLNEIIYHRKNAQLEVESLLLEEPEKLEDYIRFRGSENVNVYISAYAYWEERKKRKAKFYEFLKYFAPYTTEEELKKYLETIGIETINLNFILDGENTLNKKIFNALKNAYDNDIKSKYDRKIDVLIKHEARQLTQLEIDLENNIKPIFISGDLRLRRLAHGDILEKPGNAVVSNLAFVQLIDLLLGVRGNPITTTKLFWGGIIYDEIAIIRNYLISHALEFRDEIMTKSLPEAINIIAEEGKKRAEQNNISLSPGGTTIDEIRGVRLLESIEDDFYANMANIIDRKFPDEFNYAKKVRLRELKEKIKDKEDLITRFKDKISQLDDKKEKARLKQQISELERYLSEYRIKLLELENKSKSIDKDH